MNRQGILSLALIALLTACGGGSGGSEATSDTLPTPSVTAASCATALLTAIEYECRVAPLSEGDEATSFGLNNAPEGMVIQAGSGVLHWTPALLQQGMHPVVIIRRSGSQVNRTSITFNVTAGGSIQGGIFVSPNGDNANSGSNAEDALLTLQAAVDQAAPGDVIYLRGGDYYNEEFGTSFSSRSKNNLARITSSGTASDPITIRPFGNEYVRLISDVNGLVFNNARFWRVQGIELAGNTPALSRDISLSLWWTVTGEENRIQGRGIAANSAFNLEIIDCIIHDFPGAGLSNNGGAYITLADSIVYNNAWWSTSGTHGFANSKPETTDNADTSSIKISMLRNLLFGNQSSMISHVFSKGVVKLDIDEGNGLHMQNNAGLFFGRFLAENNLLIYNGKAGFGLNTVDNGVIRNNSFFANAQAVANSGELSLQSSNSESIANNLFHAQPNRDTLKNFGRGYPGVGTNYAVPSADSADLPPQVIQRSAVFVNPENQNFSAAAGIPARFGVDPAVLENMQTKLSEYAITPAIASPEVTPNYLRGLRSEILASWPAPVPGDGIPDNLILEDPDTGFCYAYADRNDYPDMPSSGTVSSGTVCR